MKLKKAKQDKFDISNNVYCHVFLNKLAIGVQSLVESYQRFKKWYLMPPCLTLSIIMYGSRVKWSNPGEGMTFGRVVAIEKGAFGLPSTKIANFSLMNK